MLSRKTAVGLTISSDFKFVDLAEVVSNNLAKLVGFDDDVTMWISMAVREAVINAIKHGNKQDENKQVDIYFTINSESFAVEVVDQGDGFDPTIVPDPLDPENLLKPSGRGIFYIRSFMDQVEFSSHPDGGTVVNMVRRRRSQGEGKTDAKH
jgi:serine/threonine-protein kinase RsbW